MHVLDFFFISSAILPSVCVCVCVCVCVRDCVIGCADDGLPVQLSDGLTARDAEKLNTGKGNKINAM